MSDKTEGMPAADDPFAAIRPYGDDEVVATLERVLSDEEFIAAVGQLQRTAIPGVLQWPFAQLVRIYLAWKTRKVKTVWDFQMLVRPYVETMIQRTSAGFTFTGIENIDPAKSYLFISNHRDIALDPAYLNFALVNSSMNTVRIAIGNNLLTKPFASDLMRLNKSFIVDRSAKGPRQMLQASKTLASYIRHSINDDRHSVWLAQREGRAKDGVDQTEPAIIKMLGLGKTNRSESLTDVIKSLHIVPVAISYEFDPCDSAKANELYQKQVHGTYEKAAQEDIDSIATGITGEKGHVHIALGAELSGVYETADDVAAAIDDQILSLYRLQSSNYYAYRMLGGDDAKIEALAESRGWISGAANTQRAMFESRVNSLPEAHKPFLLNMYAAPLRRKLALDLLS